MLRILLGDLRHRTLGRHSTYMPLGIGFIAAYCQKVFGGGIDIRLCDDPDFALEQIYSWRPQIIGLTNYMWNAEINHLAFDYAKSANPNVVCVAGGPEFPVAIEEMGPFLRNHPAIDFYCLLEGEKAFVSLISQVMTGVDLQELKRQPVQGLVSFDPEKNHLVYESNIERIVDLNSIPSPYLSGLFDQYFNGEYTPAIQTARGCPFTCRYCRASDSNYSKVIPFDLERVKDEITYIAKKIHGFKSIGLLIMDSNFGLLERDVQIAEHLRQMQDLYDWPPSIIADTTKNNYDRVFQMVNILQNRMQPLCSLQTTNEETLKIIKRQNLPFDQYDRMQQKLIAFGMKPSAELIVPLPLETKESFLETLRKVYSSGIENITVFTWMMLPGTELASEEYRKKYKIKSGYRVIPRQFGVYRDKKCFEIEEVCFETSSMSFEDYLQCRGYAFLCFLLGRSQYDLVKKIISNLSLDHYSFLMKLSHRMTANDSLFAFLFQELLRETKDETFPSREAIYKAYSQPENYAKLLRAEIGDNIFRKYLAKVLLDGFVSSLELIFAVLEELVREKGAITEDQQQFLSAVQKWMLLSRDFSVIFLDTDSADESIIDEFPFDVDAWTRGKDQDSLSKYQRKTKVEFRYEGQVVKDLLLQNKKLYGDDNYYCLGRMLVLYSPDVLWRKPVVMSRVAKNN